jgi:hypothetical protein
MPTPPQSRWRFSLRTLLLVMTGCCVVFAFPKFSLAVAALLGATLMAGILLWAAILIPTQLLAERLTRPRIVPSRSAKDLVQPSPTPPEHAPGERVE